MYAVALLQGMVFYGPIATLYRQAQGVSLYQITIIESISLALMILLEIPWGYVADRIGYKKTLVICNALYFVSKIVFWKATGFVWFLSERLLLSIVMSGISGCDSAYLYLSAGEKESHKVFGVYSAMNTSGLVIASVVFSAVAADNYPLSGFLTVVSYGLSMLLSLFLGNVRMEQKRVGLRSSIKEVSSALKANKRFFIFLIAMLLLMESNQTLTVFMSQVQYVRSNIPVNYMGYIYILLSVSGLIAAVSGRFSARFGETKLSKLLFLSATLACGITAITNNALLSVAMIILLRVSASLFFPLGMQIQNRQVTIADRATMLSVYSSTMNLGAVFTNLVFGKLADVGVDYAFGMGAVFCFLGLILYSVWVRKKAS